MDDPELALPVTNPWNFFPDYELELSDSDVSRIGVADPDDAQVYVTVRAADALENFTANLRAPILIAHARGFQVINQIPDTPVRVHLLAQVEAETAAAPAA
jgi:flagellar assembly factor FliW